MKRKLEVITQTLSPIIEEKEAHFASVLSIQPDDENAALTHGSLYSVFELKTSEAVDTQLIIKVVTDVLHNSYYTAQSSSPIQPLEKAVLELKDKIASMGKDLSSNLDFNISISVLWGEVVYIVTFGQMGVYIMREGILKEVDAISEGGFSIASGLVKDGDIVFLSSKAFIDQFGPDKVFKSTTPIKQTDLEAGSSALVIKFQVVEEFSEGEIVDIQVANTSLGIKKESDKSVFKLKQGILKLRPKTTPKPQKVFAILLLILVLTAFIGSVYMLYQANSTLSAQEELQKLINRGKDIIAKDELSQRDLVTLKSVENQVEKVKELPQVQGVYKEIEESLNSALNLKRVESSVFYDLALVDEQAKPSEIQLVNNKLVVVDNTSGKIYVSALDTAKFVAEPLTFPSIKNLSFDETSLVFTDASTYKLYDLETSKVINMYNLPNPKLVLPYLDFIYEIDDNKIVKYTKTGVALTNSVWTTDASLTNAVSFIIDISIYALNSDGSISKFTAGSKDVFVLANIDSPIKKPGKIYTVADSNSFYISDLESNRIVVLAKDGKFEKQYMDAEKTKWADLKDFTITNDEKTMYLLVGTKVLEVTL
ncbi:MAG: hypothetical protein RLY61_349 [Candidatus Parcubacteria bacterium]|jgi:hypothetical protein